LRRISTTTTNSQILHSFSGDSSCFLRQLPPTVFQLPRSTVNRESWSYHLLLLTYRESWSDYFLPYRESRVLVRLPSPLPHSITFFIVNRPGDLGDKSKEKSLKSRVSGAWGVLGDSGAPLSPHQAPKTPRSPKTPGRLTIEPIEGKLYCVP